MTKIIGLFIVLLVSLIGFSQASEGLVDYQKKPQRAAVIELPYPPSVVIDAMNNYLSKKGKSKGNDLKGFITYRNTQTVPGGGSNADLYFKTERKSRKEKEVTVLSLLVMPNDAQTPADHLHYLSMDDAKDYLNDLATAVQAYNLELNIKDQNDAVIMAEAKYKKLTGEADDLNKKRSEIERKIVDNQKDQQKQLQEIEIQKQKLAEWVSQRRS